MSQELNEMCEELNSWCSENNQPNQCAMELYIDLSEKKAPKEQLDWLKDYCARWGTLVDLEEIEQLGGRPE